MDRELEHPHISAALRSGYPPWLEGPTGPDCPCGGELAGPVFLCEGEWLCSACFSQRIGDFIRTNPREAAALFGCDYLWID